MRGGGAPKHIVPAASVAHGLINLVQKIAGNGAVLTEVWVRLGRHSGSTASSPAVGRGRSFAVRALQGSSECLDPLGWLAVLLRRGYGG